MSSHYHFVCNDCGSDYPSEPFRYLCPLCESENLPDQPLKGVLKMGYPYGEILQNIPAKARFEELKKNHFIDLLPIAGPISVLITSNALKGRVKFCKHATNGASLADFVYVFIAVFGLTNLYSWYKPVIPYVLIIGALFLIYLGIKIFKTKLDLEHIGEDEIPEAKLKKKDQNGFWTGFLLNFLNPTLFFRLAHLLFLCDFICCIYGVKYRRTE